VIGRQGQLLGVGKSGRVNDLVFGGARVARGDAVARYSPEEHRMHDLRPEGDAVSSAGWLNAPKVATPVMRYG
jgi:hypothetical protein